jgi:hypothetical protein
MWPRATRPCRQEANQQEANNEQNDEQTISITSPDRNKRCSVQQGQPKTPRRFNAGNPPATNHAISRSANHL